MTRGTEVIAPVPNDEISIFTVFTGPTKSRQQADNADNKSRAPPTRRQQVLNTSKMTNKP